MIQGELTLGELFEEYLERCRACRASDCSQDDAGIRPVRIRCSDQKESNGYEKLIALAPRQSPPAVQAAPLKSPSLNQRLFL